MNVPGPMREPSVQIPGQEALSYMPPTPLAVPEPAGLYSEAYVLMIGNVRDIMSDMERMDMDQVAESIRRSKDEMQRFGDAVTDAATKLEDGMVNAALATHEAMSMAIGEMVVNFSDGAESMKEAFKSIFVVGIKSIGEYLRVLAIAHLVPGIMFNPVAAAGYFAASTGAFVAAGVIQALHEGGFVQKSGLFALEKGEAVVPKERASGGITVNQYVQGSVLSERQLERLAVSAIAKAGRGY